jgi:hypothetical protein
VPHLGRRRDPISRAVLQLCAPWSCSRS